MSEPRLRTKQEHRRRGVAHDAAVAAERARCVAILRGVAKYAGTCEYLQRREIMRTLLEAIAEMVTPP